MSVMMASLHPAVSFRLSEEGIELALARLLRGIRRRTRDGLVDVLRTFRLPRILFGLPLKEPFVILGEAASDRP